MVISGLRYREIYPQKELSWELSLQDLPTTGDTYFKFYFSGLNSGLLEIFNIKNKKIYSNEGKLLGGYNGNTVISFSGEINNNYYSLYQNNKNLFIGHYIPNNFDESFIKGFVLESKNTNFIDFKSLKILGERPEYFIDYTSNFEYLENNIPIYFYNSGEFPFLIYSGKSLDNSFELSVNNLTIPSSGLNSFNLINSRFLNGYRKVPIVLYSEIGQLNFNLDLSGFKIDESIYYLTFGPSTRIIRSETNNNYILSFFNINQTNLTIEFKYISGLTGDYRPPKFVVNNFNSDDNIVNNLTYVEKAVKDFSVSGFISGSGFLSAPISGIINYFNPINQELESGIGIGEAQEFIYATPKIEYPVKLLQTFQSTGLNGDFGFSSLYKNEYIFIGEPNDSSILFNNGSVHVFKGNPLNNYNFQQKINNPETGSINNNFGFSFSSNFNNRRLFIGSLKDNFLGAVYCYTQDDSTLFTRKQKILYTGGGFYSFNISGYCFGYSITNNFSGDKLFISAINDSYLYLENNQQDHGSINIYKTSLNSIKSGLYNDYIFDRKITGYLNFNNSNLINFGEFLYTNNQGNLLFTNNHNEYTNLIYIFQEQNNDWILKQTINTLNTGNRYFYVNKNCTTLGIFEKYLDQNNILSIYKQTGTQWELSQRFTGILNNDSRFIIDENESVLTISESNLKNLKIFTGNVAQYNFAAYTENNIQNDYSGQNNIFTSHDSTTIGVRSGDFFNLYRYSPPNFVEFNYQITLTGIGDAYLFTDIPAKVYINDLKYSGPVTFLGGYLTGFFTGIGTGVQRDDYFGWEYDNQGILRLPTTLSNNSLDILCRFRPELSICSNRSIFDVSRPIITGFISGIDTKFIKYTGVIYADYRPEDLTTVVLKSPLIAITGRQTGIFDIFGFVTASGIPNRISGKILGDFAQFFEPGTWTITKPWAGIVSGNEFLNLLDEEAFDSRLLQIKKFPTSGFIITGLKTEITFKDFCSEDLAKFPPVFEISGVIPPFVQYIVDPEREYDPRSYRFAKDVFAVSPILSGIEWQYENSEFQLQSGFQFIFSGFPAGGRTRISRLGYTLSGDGYFNNLFQLPFYGEPEKDASYISKNVTLEEKEVVGFFNNYKVQKTDISGNPIFKQKLDFFGNPEFKQTKKCKIVRNSDGNPIFDQNGNAIIIPATPLTLVNSFDEEGNAILDTEGNPVLTYDCEPELDTEGKVLLDYFYKNEIFSYKNLNIDSNNYYDNFLSIKLSPNNLFYLTFSGILHNGNILWESAFDENSPWEPFSLYDESRNSKTVLTGLSFNDPFFPSVINLSGKLPFGKNYLRIKSETQNTLYPALFYSLSFSGVRKSKIPILIPDYYEITNQKKFAGWEESLKTVDFTLYDTGIPPCIETIRTPTFFFDPCDVTILKFNIIKPTFYVSGDIEEPARECFEKCFAGWPKTESIFAYSGFFSGYISNFVYNITADNILLTPLKFANSALESCVSGVTIRCYRNSNCGLNIGCALYKDAYLNPAVNGYYKELTSHIFDVVPKWYRVLDGLIVQTGSCGDYVSSSSSSSSLVGCSGDNIYVAQTHLGNCAVINPIKIYTNNNFDPIFIQITGTVDDDLLINDEIYENGFYPFWSSGCNYPPGTILNGPHAITPYNNIINPGDSFKIGIQSYGNGNIFCNLCVVTGFVSFVSSSSSSSNILLPATESMWISVD